MSSASSTATTGGSSAREREVAPYGRCGDIVDEANRLGGCGTPLRQDQERVCDTWPNCCLP